MPELPTPLDSPEELAAAGDLRAAISKLGPAEQAALFCHFYMDMPMDRVARVLRVSPATARSRVYRAAQKLRPDSIHRRTCNAAPTAPRRAARRL